MAVRVWRRALAKSEGTEVGGVFGGGVLQLDLGRLRFQPFDLTRLNRLMPTL
jgi:hypothetical protein